MIVVKVGGSLYDLPDFRERLLPFLESLPEPIVIVPGGGAMADTIRERDREYQLGNDVAHHLAIQAMALAGEYLKLLLSPGMSNTITVLDCVEWTSRHDRLPHSWDVTSDSIAALVAIEEQASQLILLKSRSLPPGISWSQAAGMDIVDAHFPIIAEEVPCPISIVNLRSL